jgi:hypothetical protein
VPEVDLSPERRKRDQVSEGSDAFASRPERYGLLRDLNVCIYTIQKSYTLFHR